MNVGEIYENMYMLCKPSSLSKEIFLFNIYIYTQRMQITIESFLSEANDRARRYRIIIIMNNNNDKCTNNR
jgi:hypothetical protein